MARRSPKSRQQTNQLRIIGGEWRGRKLSFPDVEGLRPTHDRVRETLFNWLRADIAGARCLDLFAGSGALGFEALSRGAGEVIFVDRNRAAVQSIKNNLRELACTKASAIETDAIAFLKNTDLSVFDIIFLDPPFGKNLLAPALELLSSRLSDSVLLYMEYERSLMLPELPCQWQLVKDKYTSQLTYQLVRS